MRKLFTIATVVALCLTAQLVRAQVETKKDSVTDSRIQYQLNQLQAEKENIVTAEKEKLRKEVEVINGRADKGEITSEEARQLKEAAARKSAENIENKLAIIDNKIALVKRGELYEFNLEEGTYIGIDPQQKKEEDTHWPDDWDDFWEVEMIFDHKRKYDKRTTSDIVLAAGFNNAIIEGQSFDDTPYKVGGSRFFEIGWQWKTRVFRNTNFMRIVYGLNFQFNGLKPDDNQYFVKDGDLTYLEPFEASLDKSKLRMDNLVIPVYFEFGPSKMIDRGDYFRYSTRHKFRIGLGGYFGLNYSTRQKLKYKIDGDRHKEKIKNNYNTNNTIYGLAGYMGFGDLSLYMKYDLNTIFKDGNRDENNIAVGLRWEL
ncbi:hypothetical protein [Robertkochia solimangrovi]|uniref:hypothetical protein n=1 Tax=Robertkochia solimangrovi TaxID=2213046 RepID=UPI0011805002|nr:hypothetical protein [Robertkochia solimangrovi]TRZ44372.1 hypothetical protein DMZ48_07645 [Robertkochia solimangrovi]